MCRQPKLNANAAKGKLIVLKKSDSIVKINEESLEVLNEFVYVDVMIQLIEMASIRKMQKILLCKKEKLEM